MELRGRTALLTGATGGLGRAIATALADRGATLVLSSGDDTVNGTAVERGSPARSQATATERSSPTWRSPERLRG